jgi:2-keto-4-pentenoate hydratase
MFQSHAEIDEAAQSLRDAQVSGQPCKPIRDSVAVDDLKSGYEVQPKNVDRAVASGRPVVGRKIGLTSPVVIDILNARADALAAREIVDSPIAEWDIRITDTIADNGSAGLFVLGSQPVPLAEVNLPQIAMAMTQNGQLVSEGSGSACLGTHLTQRFGWPMRCRRLGLHLLPETSC